MVTKNWKIEKTELASLIFKMRMHNKVLYLSLLYLKRLKNDFFHGRKQFPMTEFIMILFHSTIDCKYQYLSKFMYVFLTWYEDTMRTRHM